MGILLDLRAAGLSGAKGEKGLEEIGIACNKNTVPGDKSALNPSGVRLGTPALATRGMNEEHIKKVVAFIDSAFKLAAEIQETSGPKLVDFKSALYNEENQTKIQSLRADVEQFSLGF